MINKYRRNMKCSDIMKQAEAMVIVIISSKSKTEVTWAEYENFFLTLPQGTDGRPCDQTVTLYKAVWLRSEEKNFYEYKLKTSWSVNACCPPLRPLKFAGREWASERKRECVVIHLHLHHTCLCSRWLIVLLSRGCEPELGEQKNVSARRWDDIKCESSPRLTAHRVASVSTVQTGLLLCKGKPLSSLDWCVHEDGHWYKLTYCSVTQRAAAVGGATN